MIIHSPTVISRIGSVTLLLLAFAGALTAQAGPVAPDAVAAATRAPSAEEWFRRGTWLLSVQVGGAAFTDFQRGMARPVAAEAAGQRLRRRVSAGTTGSAGVSASYWLTNTWGVRAAAAFAPSSFSVWTEQDAHTLVGADAAEPEYAGLGVLLADVAVVFRFPRTFGRVVPYGLVGGGFVRYTTGSGGELPPEARARFATGAHLAPAGLLGLGAAIPLQRRSLMLTFELTSHVAPTPLDDAGAGNSFDMAGVPLRLESEGERVGTDGVGVTNAMRLMVGLTLPLR